MPEVEAGKNPRHASVRSHRALHPAITPTRLTLDSSIDDEQVSTGVWRSRRSRKRRYSPVTHLIANEHSINLPSAEEQGNRGALLGKKSLVALRIQTERKIKPHLILDVTFWLAVTFTFGSAIWVVNGESIVRERSSTNFIQAFWSGSRSCSPNSTRRLLQTQRQPPAFSEDPCLSWDLI